MEKLYSIGETSKIMGISVQTLRNYSNSSLLSPAYVNEETGYRYFSFSQFHIIDRIKYLRGFGLSLGEIENIMTDGNIDNIIYFLERQNKKIDQQIHDLTMTKEDVQWYINYFKYLNKSDNNALPHVTFFPERNILITECPKDHTIEDIEVTLTTQKTEYLSHNFHFHRQFGYLLSYDTIIAKDWRPFRYFTYISDYTESITDDKNIMTLPAGDYLCFSFRLRHMEELNVNLIQEYFKSRKLPPYVIANEHEDNLTTYTYCPYELQFLLTPHDENQESLFT